MLVPERISPPEAKRRTGEQVAGLRAVDVPLEGLFVVQAADEQHLLAEVGRAARAPGPAPCRCPGPWPTTPCCGSRCRRTARRAAPAPALPGLRRSRLVAPDVQRLQPGQGHRHADAAEERSPGKVVQGHDRPRGGASLPKVIVNRFRVQGMQFVALRPPGWLSATRQTGRRARESRGTGGCGRSSRRPPRTDSRSLPVVAASRRAAARRRAGRRGPGRSPAACGRTAAATASRRCGEQVVAQPVEAVELGAVAQPGAACRSAGRPGPCSRRRPMASKPSSAKPNGSIRTWQLDALRVAGVLLDELPHGQLVGRRFVVGQQRHVLGRAAAASRPAALRRPSCRAGSGWCATRPTAWPASPPGPGCRRGRTPSTPSTRRHSGPLTPGMP